MAHQQEFSPASPPPSYSAGHPTEFQQLRRRITNAFSNPAASVNTYARSLFPIVSWLPKYNRTWLAADLIAGITVGIVVVPQALAYAKLASLPTQYGLYTSFTGVLLYCFFATSKDVTIGATAVVSQLTGQLIASHASSGQYQPVPFAIALAFLTGLIQLGLGLFRLGIIVDFIPNPVVAGFTSGAGIQIIVGQIAGLFGVPNINTNQAPYLVLGHSLAHLNQAALDAAFGFASLFALLFIKFGCDYFVRRGHRSMYWLGVSRNAIVVILFTLISFGVNRHHSKSLIKIVGDVPKGFQGFQAPDMYHIRGAASSAITVVIVAILEHTAVTKSYGRLHGYRPDPNQELVALGLTNFLGSFLGAFPATGSFSRSAIKSQSGVRTPLAALFTSAIVVFALYFLTPLFHYIPSATLSAIIVAAISELISRPAAIRQLWNISLLDVFVFVLALLFTFFFSIEIAIYVSVGFSVVVLLYRMARPHHAALARITETGLWVSVEDAQLGSTATPPPPGVMVFKLEESMTYPNANYFAERIKDVVINSTEFGGVVVRPDQKLWCDDTDRRVANARKKTNQIAIHDVLHKVGSENTIGTPGEDHSTHVRGGTPLHRLRALVFDFSSVNGLDTTGVQMLVDLRRDVDNYAGQRVEFHFAHVHPRFERILSYFLRITRTDRDVMPVVPHNAEQSNENVGRSASRAGDSSASIQIDHDDSSASLPGHAVPADDKPTIYNLENLEVARFFHPTVDDAVQATAAKDVEAGYLTR
ncbi:hypothetical protein HKX48_006120 [Thoreauomyces humboldtii]|nr:hypothetical protein HKX48_006120 [Thoreauomyces humboldtii]